jgi:hypothetical protein
VNVLPLTGKADGRRPEYLTGMDRGSIANVMTQSVVLLIVGALLLWALSTDFRRSWINFDRWKRNKRDGD